MPREEVVDAECDVYAACGVGGALNVESVPRERCRVVAGSANNQPAAAADRLVAAGPAAHRSSAQKPSGVM